MSKEPFMLVSLKEEKAQKLSRVLGNKTATKLLEFLTGRDATESEISKKLKIPLSTVHYNLQQLVEAKLVIVEEFHYSSRGKEVNHYKLANKYIIIAPKEETSFLEHLKKYVPVGVITLGLAAILKTMQLFTAPKMAESALFKAAPQAARDAGVGEGIAAPKAAEIAAIDNVAVEAMHAVDQEAGAAAIVQQEVKEAVVEETVGETVRASASITPSYNCITEGGCVVLKEPWWQSQAVDWMIVGVLIAFGLFLLIEFIRWRRMR